MKLGWLEVFEGHFSILIPSPCQELLNQNLLQRWLKIWIFLIKKKSVIFLYGLGNKGLGIFDKILSLPQCIYILYPLVFCIAKKKKKVKERRERDILVLQNNRSLTVNLKAFKHFLQSVSTDGKIYVPFLQTEPCRLPSL